jgi:hypothetical protein
VIGSRLEDYFEHLYAEFIEHLSKPRPPVSAASDTATAGGDEDHANGSAAAVSENTAGASVSADEEADEASDDGYDEEVEVEVERRAADDMAVVDE